MLAASTSIKLNEQKEQLKRSRLHIRLNFVEKKRKRNGSLFLLFLPFRSLLIQQSTVKCYSVNDSVGFLIPERIEPVLEQLITMAFHYEIRNNSRTRQPPPIPRRDREFNISPRFSIILAISVGELTNRNRGVSDACRACARTKVVKDGSLVINTRPTSEN